MEKTIVNEGRGYKIAAALLVVVMALILAGVAGAAHYVSQPGTVQYTCSDFTTYAQAKEAYDNGATYLDSKQDRDEIPCNELYRKSIKDT